MNECKWIFKKSLFVNALMPSCNKEANWFEEYFIDKWKFKFCPYCGKEIVKTELAQFDQSFLDKTQ